MFEKIRDKLYQDISAAKNSDFFKVAKPEKHYAPKTKISYKPTLISSLEAEHKEILTLLSKTQRLVDTSHLEAARMQLIIFKDLLVDHLLKENTSLYIYLRQAEESIEKQSKLQSLKYEMEKIGHKIKHLIDDSIKGSDLSQLDLSKNVHNIRALLEYRIKLEETKIYPFYHDVS